MLLQRLWTYQNERFPLATHGALIAAFSSSAIAFSAYARHAALPGWPIFAAGFVSSLIFFMQLRIADEWKDAAEDAAHRPYRPVPRGLVSLRELAWVAAGGAVVQLAIAFVVSPPLVPLLAVVWIYLGLMTREFFIPGWLRAHPVAYILSHMAIMPLIDAYVSSFDWQVAGVAAPHALSWFLAVTFFNGLAIEIGRKIRAPHDEEPGVETYSRLWGGSRAAVVWLGAFAATAALAVITAASVNIGRFNGPLYVIAACIAIACALTFVRTPNRSSAKRIETVAGGWTVVVYASLGLLPFALRGSI